MIPRWTMYGAVRGHHNKLFYNYVERYNIHVDSEGVVEEAARENNLELFDVYASKLSVLPHEALYNAAYYINPEILDRIRKTKKPLESPKFNGLISTPDELNDVLFHGYIVSGNLKKARAIYDQISPSERKSVLEYLPDAAVSDSIETFLYAEQLYRELGGSPKKFNEIAQLRLSERKENILNNESYWYFLRRHPESRSWIFKILVSGDDFGVLIRFTNEFLTPQELPALLARLKSERGHNKCYIEWLELQTSE